METDTPVRETERILTDEEAAERAARKEAAREARRKKKQRKKRIKTALLIVLAVILVIVAAFAGFLLYLQKCGTEYDNITECVQSQPMDFTQRYAFSSADKTMSVRLDKNDLWWLLYQTGAIEKLEKMDTALADKNIRLSGMGISTDNNALTANVELTCFGSVRIPLSANCGVSVDDTDITISVNSIKLGNGWGLPMNFVCNRFDVEPSALYVKISRSIHPFLNDLTQLTVADGCVVIKMNATDKLFAEALANADQVKELSKFGIESPALAAVVEAASGTGDTAFRTALDSFADANAYADFRTSALALGTVDAASAYMSNQDYAPYIQRFLPSLTLEGVTSLMNTISRVKHTFNPSLEIEGVLLTMLDGRTNLSLQVVESVKKHFRDKVFSVAIPRNVRLGEAPSHGVPIHMYDPRSLGTESYRRLAQELLERNRSFKR